MRTSSAALSLAAAVACAAIAAACSSSDGDDASPQAVAPDWSAGATLPAGGDRRDVYGLGAALPDVASRGLLHASTWPVTVSGVLLPARPVEMIFDPKATSADVLALQDVGRSSFGFGTMDEMYAWLGLSRRGSGEEAFEGVRWPAEIAAGEVLGAGRLETSTGRALTFSCATCHVATFFGKPIVGLANRRSRANVFFGLAKRFFPFVTPAVLKDKTQATDDEIAMMERSKANLPAVGWKEPKAHGLDTSLAQVALSLSRRNADAWATRDQTLEAIPRENDLDTLVADSKPAVWWSLKYKTRWLADGSIVSGNPVFTNFLWNELGRGTDLHDLAGWLDANDAIVRELTALVFAVTPPTWQDVFPSLPIDVASAKRGEPIFEAHCATCHGSYEKSWDAGTRTTRVRYHAETPVLDVGTDPQRAAGMAAFAPALNALAISKQMGTVVEVQSGYVPPPLEAIWARYPYLHNQSVPTLCEMLRPAKLRTKSFWLGPDADVATDFDAACVGLPVGDATPASWKTDAKNEMDTTKPGLSNAGHDAHLVDASGNELLDDAARRDLVEFLKTL